MRLFSSLALEARVAGSHRGKQDITLAGQWWTERQCEQLSQVIAAYHRLTLEPSVDLKLLSLKACYVCTRRDRS